MVFFNLDGIAERSFVVSASGPRPNLLDFVFALSLKVGFRPRISQEVADSVTAVALVAVGFGVSLVPAATATLRLRNVAFKPLIHSNPVGVDLH